jgi:CubicO group peptidase (beta-lactamase class C family)
MSGLSYGLQNRTNVDAAYRASNLDVARMHLSSDEYIDRLSKLPLEFSPGERWNYSVSTDVLGVAVERISGQRLGDYFERHIFAPLGMTETAFGVRPDDRERLVDAYQYIPGKAPKMIDGGATSRLGEPGKFDSGGGGLVSTIADYHRFAAMLVGRGALDGVRIVAPKTLDLMTANHLPDGKDLTQVSESLFSEANNAGTGFGLGFAMVIDPARTLIPSSKGEFYWGGAYSTAFFVDPVEKVTMVFMTQVFPSSVYPIRRQLKTMIYSALADSRA